MTSPVVLGMDFGGTKIAAAVCDYAGERLGTTTVPVHPHDSAAVTFERGLTAARALLAETAAGRRLAAVGACTFGIPGEDGIALAPTIPGWSEIAFGRQLREAFDGAAISYATDVKAAAQAEASSGALIGCDPGIYVNLGTGLAVAIVSNGVVIDGYNRASGEIGYNLRSVGDVGLAPGIRTLLEESISGGALRRTSAGPLPPIVTVEPAFVAELAFHLVNLAIAIDPQRIAVGGGMVRSWSELEAGLVAALNAAVPFPPDLVVADHPFDAPLLGALAMASTTLGDVRSPLHTQGASA